MGPLSCSEGSVGTSSVPNRQQQSSVPNQTRSEESLGGENDGSTIQQHTTQALQTRGIGLGGSSSDVGNDLQRVPNPMLPPSFGATTNDAASSGDGSALTSTTTTATTGAKLTAASSTEPPLKLCYASVSSSTSSNHTTTTTIRTPSVFQFRKLRSGKWIPEEEDYAELLISLFEKGRVTDCENGMTLRSYLSQKLHCAPMRISKKFAGKGIGKMIYLAPCAYPGFLGFYKVTDSGSGAKLSAAARFNLASNMPW